jgi:hypothetical protein
MRIRLRPAHTWDRLREICAEPHAHAFWPDHRLRVAQTIALIRELGIPDVIADLSCGDAAIGRALAPQQLILGDFAPGYEICGPIEETIQQIPHVGLFICSETIEHLDDPDEVLRQIRLRADTLALSTPIGEVTDSNDQHYWGWDTDGVHAMLTAAGWQPEYMCCAHYLSRPGSGWAPASYQIWGCK